MMGDKNRVPWDPSAIMAGALASRGRSVVGDAASEDALYDQYVAAKAAGRSMFAASLEHTHAAVLERVAARRAPPVVPEEPLQPRQHLDTVAELRAAGRTREAAVILERFAGPIATERAERAAEIAARKAAAEAAAPKPANTPPPSPRRHLDEFDRLNAAGQRVAALQFEREYGPLIEHERVQREAEVNGGDPLPPTIEEIFNAGRVK